MPSHTSDRSELAEQVERCPRVLDYFGRLHADEKFVLTTRTTGRSAGDWVIKQYLAPVVDVAQRTVFQRDFTLIICRTCTSWDE
jgi:hypothetical protein